MSERLRAQVRRFNTEPAVSGISNPNALVVLVPEGKVTNGLQTTRFAYYEQNGQESVMRTGSTLIDLRRHPSVNEKDRVSFPTFAAEAHYHTEPDKVLKQKLHRAIYRRGGKVNGSVMVT